MANKPMKSIKLPTLDDTYTFTQVDSTLSTAGKAADAKATGDEITQIKSDLTALGLSVVDGMICITFTEE